MSPSVDNPEINVTLCRQSRNYCPSLQTIQKLMLPSADHPEINVTLCRPSRNISIGSHRYVLNMLDCISNRIWAFCQQHRVDYLRTMVPSKIYTSVRKFPHLYVDTVIPQRTISIVLSHLFATAKCGCQFPVSRRDSQGWEIDERGLIEWRWEFCGWHRTSQLHPNNSSLVVQNSCPNGVW